MSAEEEWTVDANEAVTISLVQPTDGAPKKIESFKPQFTYALFGEEQRIFGYKGLRVNLLYNASDLRPNLTIASSRKFKTVGDVEPVDVEEIMKELLPEVAFQKKSDYEQAIRQIPQDWTPPGELIKSIERDGETYEIWKGSLADPAVKQLVKRTQICVLFYIEGGSYIGQDEDGNDEPDYSLARWTVYFLYKKQADVEGASKYIFQGYATVYDFWHFELPTPPASPGNAPIQAKVDHDWELPTGDMPYADMPHRARISQFLILPPFQGKGAGSMLYNTIFEVQSKEDTTKEITVEDPNEAFDLLRDLCDLKYLRKNVPEFAALSINTEIDVSMRGGILRHNLQVTHGNKTSPKGIVDIDALEALRVRVKIAPRQFSRLVEMYLMSKLPPSVRPVGMNTEETVKTGKPSQEDKKIYTLWRLLVKQRVYRRNATLLEEFEVTERIIKLNDTIDNIEFEYANILERLDAPRPAAVVEDNETTVTMSLKRKSEDEESGQQTSKKLKTDA